MLRSSRLLRIERPDIEKRYRKNVLWSPSCFAASCGGGPLGIIRQYVEQQKKPLLRALYPRPEGWGFTARLGSTGGALEGTGKPRLNALSVSLHAKMKEFHS